MRGNIDQYLSTNSSKTTKDLQKVLFPLEHPSNSGRPHTLLVEGSPGIGKSVFLKQISYLWASKKLLTNSDFLFLLQLRDPAVHQMKSLEYLVHHFYKYEKEAYQIALSCAAHLLQDDGKSVTILLDGYDELPADLRQNSFIADILQGRVLPASVIVVSSRPHTSTRLRDNVTHRVEILGFSEEDQTHFIQQSLEGQEEKILRLSNYLKTHPTIASLCFVPFNMTILLFLYKEQTTLPTSSSDLYKLFICLTICRHLTKSGKTLDEDVAQLDSLPQPYSDFITQLALFAFKALNKNQLVFTLAEIKEHCPAIVDHPNGFGLLQAVEYVGLMSRTRSFNFVHFSVQEFFAAYYITTVPADEEHSILKEYFWSNIHYNMFNFYIALTSGQRSSFKQFLRSGDDTITINDKFLEDKLQHLRLYRIFQEAGDVSACKTYEEKITDEEIDLSFTTLLPNNLEDLTTLLTCSSCRNWKRLNLNSCHIQDYGLRLLHRTLNHSNTTIDTLRLYNNDLSSSSDSFLSDIIITCKVKELSISNNKGVGETVNFFTALTHPSCVIEELVMWGSNYSTTRWATELFSSLRKNKTVKKLWVGSSNISDDVCDVICDALHVNNSLRELYMNDNPISGQAAELILDALKDNNTLELLNLPSYPDNIKEIASLVNKKRTRRGCDVKLKIKFSLY